jgi:hypothetical protein
MVILFYQSCDIYNEFNGLCSRFHLLLKLQFVTGVRLPPLDYPTQ